ncbi:CRISPR-associated endonuclease Cas2 [Saccharibacter sp. 17.LH.SD]|uniref:CRISPR-associated endonuclease Cas2 n=1 Tax=Saccharibacter sp. 17.LH.SD TaxID=2689393 RepID=UPI00136818D6|nr:CRISPR-associated endonuclease Cas2 [Saccharibacter sp. 17.LH.SD]MXV43535.1 CRISPR-associated endonuclease Cas2 [Saccharibacter sp. 17.LH.SD]
MKAEEARFLWLMIFFDLPVRTKTQRRQATRFRNFLRHDGFIMVQYSVYARIGRGKDSIEKHLRRVRTALPREGSVRALHITDKQYGRMEIMLGFAKKTEKTGEKQMILL